VTKRRHGSLGPIGQRSTFTRFASTGMSSSVRGQRPGCPRPEENSAYAAPSRRSVRSSATQRGMRAGSQMQGRRTRSFLLLSPPDWKLERRHAPSTAQGDHDQTSSPDARYCLSTCTVFFHYVATVSTGHCFSAVPFTFSNAASRPLSNTLAASIRPNSRISEATSPVQPV
jgi:hypothetical protein